MFEQVQSIHTARVPVVKLRDALTRTECDVCFNNTTALHNTALLRLYCRLDPRRRVQDLGLVVKAWAGARNVKRADAGTLSSYAWCVMVVFYLQQVRLLPCLQAPPFLPVSGRGRRTNQGHDVTFCSEGPLLEAAHAAAAEHPATLGQLLLGFFEFYAGAEVSPAARFPRLASNPLLAELTGQEARTRPDPEAGAPAASRPETAGSPESGSGGQAEPGGLPSQRFDASQHTVCIRRGEGLLDKALRWAGDEPPSWRFSIADPFEQAHDLGRVVSQQGNARIIREIRRAAGMLRLGASLDEVLMEMGEEEKERENEKSRKGPGAKKGKVAKKGSGAKKASGKAGRRQGSNPRQGRPARRRGKGNA
jgi:hypothetical protein